MKPLSAYLLLLGLAWLPRVPGTPPLLTQHAGLLLAAAMILLPLLPALTAGGEPGYRLEIPPRLSELGPGLLACLVLLPGFHLLVTSGFLPLPAHQLHLTGPQVPAFAALHLINVVLPEELFFRAYLQPAWDDGRGWHFLGIRWHRGVLFQALAFGFLHVVSYGMSWQAFDRVLPGLAFGYLRERTGTVWSPVLFHLACNLYLFLQ